MSEALEQLETHIDHLLLTLRRAMLGCLTPCLPVKLVTRSEQRRAIRSATERLTLCFALTNSPVSAATLQSCRSRLYAVVTYLYFECLCTDQTFDALLRLVELEMDILTQMVARARHTPRSFLRYYRHIPEIDGNIESAVLLYLAQDDRLPPVHICTLAVERSLETLRQKCS